NFYSFVIEKVSTYSVHYIYTVTTPLEFCWMMGCYVLVCCCVVIFLLRNQKATGYIFPINDYLSDTNISE
ncbi:hypothetical protein, partial [Alloprevotella tannerae]|uniref:hypothetical protein n=1 Tax=Alloprevotella tannerae TaxID=76122 RepID=UPI0025F0BAC7